MGGIKIKRTDIDAVSDITDLLGQKAQGETTSSSTSVAGQLKDFNGRAENLHKALEELKHIRRARSILI